ncbi:MAG: cation transporter [Frankiaceae bacterium]
MSEVRGRLDAQTAVVEVAGLSWASETATVESVLGRRPGVVSVAANPVGQTATVTFDPAQTSLAEIAGWIRDCGYHCSGQSLPTYLCPVEAPTPDWKQGAPVAGGPAVTEGRPAGVPGSGTATWVTAT